MCFLKPLGMKLKLICQEYLASPTGQHLQSVLLTDAMYAFDTIAYWHIVTVQEAKKLLDTYFPQEKLRIKHVILHYSGSENQQLDLTPYIESTQFNYSGLIGFLEGYVLDGNNEIGLDIHQVKDLHLEIVYHQGDENKKYRIVYDKVDKINFPPYQYEEAKEHAHSMADNYQNGVLFATYNEEDVTDLVKEYAGPKGNFYQDKDIYLSLDKMKYALHVYRDKNDPNHELIITDNFAKDHVFQEGDKLILSSNDDNTI